MAKQQSNEPTPHEGTPDGDVQKVDGPAVTTRDVGDLGVPMLPGSPDEPQGPEDALGVGATRGDYRDRIGAAYQPHTGTDAQRPNAENIGDEPGVKGGVDTTA